MTETRKRHIERRVGYVLFHLFTCIARIQQRLVTDRASRIMAWMERKGLCCSRHGWKGED